LLTDFNKESIKMGKESYQDVIARLGKVAIYAHGLTQAQFAAKIGIGRVTLNLFLNRRCDLRPATAQRMVEALNLGSLIEKTCGNETAA
jgi:transcriptional regulator with XRE-family HTH domain